MGRHRTAEEKGTLQEEALRLRSDGVTRKEMAERLGVTAWVLQSLLQDATDLDPRKRPRARDDLKERARALRQQRHSVPSIARQVGVSRSTVSLWVRDIAGVVPRSDEQAEAARRRAHRRSMDERRREREVWRQERRDEGSALLETGPDRDLMIAGVVAYWCEGGKNKPWRRLDRVTFANSDVSMIVLFLRFLEACGVEQSRVRMTLYIHEQADVAEAQRQWRSLIPEYADRWRRTTLKKGNPSSPRRNTGDSYRGCVRVEVMQSAALYLQIEGAFEALVAAACETLPPPSDGLG